MSDRNWQYRRWVFLSWNIEISQEIHIVRKNIRMKNLLFSKGKSNSTKIYPSWGGGGGGSGNFDLRQTDPHLKFRIYPPLLKIFRCPWTKNSRCILRLDSSHIINLCKNCNTGLTFCLHVENKILCPYVKIVEELCLKRSVR